MTLQRFESLPSDPHHCPDRACAGMSTEVFFPRTESEAVVAQRICAVCPVLAQCAVWALREPLPDAVVASVWMRGADSSAGDRRAVRAQLKQVAATGATRFDELAAVA